MNRTGYGLPSAKLPSASFVYDSGWWAVFLMTTPSLEGLGKTIDLAINDMIRVLRTYTEDWHDHLSAAPNHRDNHELVALIEASDDADLRAWLYTEHWESR